MGWAERVKSCAIRNAKYFNVIQFLNNLMDSESIFYKVGDPHFNGNFSQMPAACRFVAWNLKRMPNSVNIYVKCEDHEDVGGAQALFIYVNKPSLYYRSDGNDVSLGQRRSSISMAGITSTLFWMSCEKNTRTVYYNWLYDARWNRFI